MISGNITSPVMPTDWPLIDVVEALNANIANRGAGYAERAGEQILIRLLARRSGSGQ
ncbi:hypothetical protein ACKI1S_48155 [Streptomyces galilaeus]|uniref:Uncharacterized protein n=1 Tax=Streptomyces galilaeus TaxID=33899 RepID=A0ABW9J1J2_STRGJ